MVKWLAKLARLRSRKARLFAVGSAVSSNALADYSRISKKHIISRQLVPATLPDFRNLGVIFRLLVGSNLMAALVSWIRVAQWDQWWGEFLNLVLWIEPVLLVHIVLGYCVHPILTKLSYRQGVCLVLLASPLISGGMWLLVHQWVTMAADWVSSRSLIATLPLSKAVEITLMHWDRLVMGSFLVTSSFLIYFNMRQRALSPALIEARLQALQARIRPHFLFNSLNGILGLIRSEPRRAEAALEDLSELFRTLMGENRQLAPLEVEVHLCRQYLSIEKLRLGERLHVHWEMDDMARSALIPPFLLQPLVENAVCHGIEPTTQSGVILVRITTRQGLLHILIRNPYHGDVKHRLGNQMAINNIRERLALHFDAEARVQTKISKETYEVRLTLPFRSNPRPR